MNIITNFILNLLHLFKKISDEKDEFILYQTTTSKLSQTLNKYKLE